jgi:hypothetical protein
MKGSEGGDKRSEQVQTIGNNITIDQRVTGNSRAYTLERLSKQRPVYRHGGDRKSRKAKENQGDVITLKRGTTGADYLAARIKRDRPDIAACRRIARE